MNNNDQTSKPADGLIYDCVIIGAGPGGLQAAIYLGRFRRKALLLDRGGGRTAHAKSIENFLTQKAISGKELVGLGLEQAKSFNVAVEKGLVTSVVKREHFEIATEANSYRAKCVIVSSGVYDNLPPIENVHTFLGTSFFTCVDCDGYKTIGKKLIVIGNSINTVRLAFAIQELYTRDITLILYFYAPPEDYQEELRERGIKLVKAEPLKIVGDERMEAVELKDGTRLPCEAIMSNFGFKLNDKFLTGLALKRDKKDFKYIVNAEYESSMSGLYIVGPLNTGNDQAIIAAGEGAVAAIDINKRLFEF